MGIKAAQSQMHQAKVGCPDDDMGLSISIPSGKLLLPLQQRRKSHKQWRMFHGHLRLHQKNIISLSLPQKALIFFSNKKILNQKKMSNFYPILSHCPFPFHSKKKQRYLHRFVARCLFFFTKALWFQSKDEPLESDPRHLNEMAGPS